MNSLIAEKEPRRVTCEASFLLGGFLWGRPSTRPRCFAAIARALASSSFATIGLVLSDLEMPRILMKVEPH